MHKNFRHHTLGIIVLFIGLFFISRTLFGVITKPRYVEIEVHRKENQGVSEESNFQKELKRAVAEQNAPGCLEMQSKARLRIKQYCKTRNEIWKKVSFL